MDRFLFDKWLNLAERESWLGKVRRRTMATMRKGLRLKDVAVAGGWSDTETLLRCFQQADAETVKQVMSFRANELFPSSNGPENRNCTTNCTT